MLRIVAQQFGTRWQLKVGKIESRDYGAADECIALLHRRPEQVSRPDRVLKLAGSKRCARIDPGRVNFMNGDGRSMIKVPLLILFQAVKGRKILVFKQIVNRRQGGPRAIDLQLGFIDAAEPAAFRMAGQPQLLDPFRRGFQNCPVFKSTRVQASSTAIPSRSSACFNSGFSVPGLKMTRAGFSLSRSACNGVEIAGER
jgi:hypothetical protein